ncbi:MAG: sigma factor [Polyangiaceae bacterium]
MSPLTQTRVFAVLTHWSLGRSLVDERPEPDTSALDAAMDRYAAGDDAAFNELYAPIAQRLLPFLRRMCGSLERAEDLLQETFVRMHRARGSLWGRSGHAWAI